MESLSVCTLQVDFESVLTISSSEVCSIFLALEATGLRNFLSVIHEVYPDEISAIFHPDSVEEQGLMFSVGELSYILDEETFGEFFSLPTDGISSFLEISPALISAARTSFSDLGRPIPLHGSKKFLKPEFRVLNDILAKAILAKKGSFDSFTEDRFRMMVAIVNNIQVNWTKVIFSFILAAAKKKHTGWGMPLSALLRHFEVPTGAAAKINPSRILTNRTTTALLARLAKQPVSRDQPAVATAAPSPPRKRQRQPAVAQQQPPAAEPQRTPRKKSSARGPLKRRKVHFIQAPTDSPLPPPPPQPAVTEAVPLSSVRPSLPSTLPARKIQKSPAGRVVLPGIVIQEPSSARTRSPEVAGKGKGHAKQTPKKPKSADTEFAHCLKKPQMKAAARLKLYDIWRFRRLYQPFSTFLTTSEHKRLFKMDSRVLRWSESSSIFEAIHRRDIVEFSRQYNYLVRLLHKRSLHFKPSDKGAKVDAAINRQLGDYVNMCASKVAACRDKSCSSQPEPSSVLFSTPYFTPFEVPTDAHAHAAAAAKPAADPATAADAQVGGTIFQTAPVAPPPAAETAAPVTPPADAYPSAAEVFHAEAADVMDSCAADSPADTPEPAAEVSCTELFPVPELPETFDSSFYSMISSGMLPILPYLPTLVVPTVIPSEVVHPATDTCSDVILQICADVQSEHSPTPSLNGASSEHTVAVEPSTPEVASDEDVAESAPVPDEQQLTEPCSYSFSDCPPPAAINEETHILALRVDLLTDELAAVKEENRITQAALHDIRCEMLRLSAILNSRRSDNDKKGEDAQVMKDAADDAAEN